MLGHPHAILVHCTLLSASPHMMMCDPQLCKKGVLRVVHRNTSNKPEIEEKRKKKETKKERTKQGKKGKNRKKKEKKRKKGRNEKKVGKG